MELQNTSSISVCIATYNGERFIRDQINSILNQLRENDEIIIVDDCSIDKTIDIIVSYSNPKIKLFINPINLGCNKTFERAISLSSNEIIFLSDQDDIWDPNKVNIVLSCFKNKKLTLCLSEAEIIDENGNKKGILYYVSRGGYKPGILRNLIKANYHGCTMAFRSRLIKKYGLPFPKNISAHDIWIGYLNEILGEVIFLNQNLTLYRKHSNNLSSSIKSNILQMFSWRLIDSINLIRRFVKYKKIL